MKKWTLSLGLLMACQLSEAKITLPALFTDHMVVQQKSTLCLYGHSSRNQEISVQVGWHKLPFTAQPDPKGNWTIEIPTPKAGGPYEISCSDGEELILHDVLVGEVWLYAGEANERVSGTAVPQNLVRLLEVQPNIALTPQYELSNTTSGWKQTTETSLRTIPAAAYFFASQLQKALKVPVGLVSCTWPDTPAEAWNSFEALERVPDFDETTRRLAALDFQPDKIEAAYAQQRKAWFQDLYAHDMGWCEDHPVWADAKYPDDNWKNISIPGAWEGQGMEGFDGVVWFRKTIDIPRSWHRKDLVLDLGPIADEDIVYYNGMEIGRSQGSQTRQYAIPRKWVRRGKATLTVRVTNYAGPGGFLGKETDLKLSTARKEPLSLSGTWKCLSGLSLAGIAPAPLPPREDPNYPTGLYNGMIHPLTRFPIQGVVWHAGASNLEGIEAYADLQKSMIADWRDKWSNPQLAFCLIQAGSQGKPSEHPEESDWALLRESQADALQMQGTGMVVTTDLAGKSSHPKSTALELGFRLSQTVLKQAYGKKRLSESPAYQSQLIEGNTIRLRFSALKKGFLHPDPIRGFTIAGTDRVFYPATVTVEKKEVIVQSPEVPHPVAVRYNWADATEGTLFDASGLPVPPFRTDRW